MSACITGRIWLSTWIVQEILLEAKMPNLDAMLDLALQLVLCQLEMDVHRAKQEIYEMAVPIKILLLKDLAEDAQPCGLDDF
ncbi:MAG: hypothetical protein JO338_02975 [Aquitalea sp.]|nr:hypothetical protein [Aquitalea sp.]